MKLLEVLIPTLAEGTCKQEGLLVIGILSQVLHLSTMEAFKEASLAILVNTPLISAVDNIIYTACSKGPALVDHDESTGIGETLIFVLLLYLCSLKRLVLFRLIIKFEVRILLFAYSFCEEIR